MEILLKTFLRLLSLIPFKFSNVLGKASWVSFYTSFKKKKKSCDLEHIQMFSKFKKRSRNQTCKGKFYSLRSRLFLKSVILTFGQIKNIKKRLKNIEEFEKKIKQLKILKIFY